MKNSDFFESFTIADGISENTGLNSENNISLSLSIMDNLQEETRKRILLFQKQLKYVKSEEEKKNILNNINKLLNK
jgi:hypothetical protein